MGQIRGAEISLKRASMIQQYHRSQAIIRWARRRALAIKPHPHAVSHIDNIFKRVPSDILNTEFNAFGKIQTIEDEGSGLRMDFTYGPDQQRWRTVLCDSTGTVKRATIYGENYEKVTENGVTREFYYLDGNVLMIRQDGDFTPYLMHKDHLGTIRSVLNDNGTFVYNANCDAWGVESVGRNYIGLHRGYTGHEMLDEFGVINMNGRLYDPVLGRFFSPDNYVQAPTNSQNFNRYSYCLNNPLKYNDPSGDFFTWSFGKGGFSIGWNFSSCGYPFGFGINIGWSHGFSAGAYGEFGPRFGGTGFGSGATVSMGGDYNFKHKSWSMTTSEGAYASIGCFNAGINGSVTYDFNSMQISPSWNVSAGVGIGDAYGGIGANVSYGSGGWSYGIGGNIPVGGGSVYYLEETESEPKGPLVTGNDVVDTDAYANLFASGNFKGFRKYVYKLFAPTKTEECPSGFRIDENGYARDCNEKIALGYTKRGVLGSKVYLFPSAFTCKEQLYLTMRHEFTHAYWFMFPWNIDNKTKLQMAHASIYKAQMNQAVEWGYRADYYTDVYKKYWSDPKIQNIRYDSNPYFSTIKARPINTMTSLLVSLYYNQ